MSYSHYQFGSTTFAKVKNSNELKQLLSDPCFDTETIIVKPNWVSAEPADFTDADALRLLFEVLDARIFVTESYSLARSLNILKEGPNFTVGDKVVNWKWLLKGEGWRWLIENPDWDWFKEGPHWNQIRREEDAFLEKHGFSDLFKDFNVTYINVTEEVWNGRIADPIEVKQSVESRFQPVNIDKLYSMIPEKLYALRGSTFISFAKLKMYASFTMKNLFGMIPDPLRPWWHGPKDRNIAHSILDINKIYHALFNVYGICEALKTTALLHPEGEFEGIYSGKYNIYEDSELVVCGSDLVSLDALLLHLTDPSKRSIAELNTEPIYMAQEEFGAFNQDHIEEAKPKVGSWLNP